MKANVSSCDHFFVATMKIKMANLGNNVVKHKPCTLHESATVN